MSDVDQGQSLEKIPDRGRWIDIMLPACLGLGVGLTLHFLMAIDGLRPTLPHFLEVATITLWFLWQRERAWLVIVFALLLGGLLAWPLAALYVPRDGSYQTAFWHAGYWRYLTTPFIVYVAVTFFATLEGGKNLKPGYRAFFDNQIRLPLVLGLAGVFSVIIWGFLYLWAEMFTIIDIKFFEDMIGQRWFYLPFSWGLGGLSIAMVRQWPGFVKAFKDFLALFCKIAAPLIAFFAVTFLAALLFSGLEPLWDTPSAAALTGIIVFSCCIVINFVRQDGTDASLPKWLRGAVSLLIVSAPFFGAIAAWAMWQRVDQYGFTPERLIYGALVMVILVYSLLCVAALIYDALGRSSKWLALYAPINVSSAVILAYIFILFHTPVLDPLKISAESQAERLVSGDVTTEEFEVGFLRFQLGAPGTEALDRLLTLDAFSDDAELKRKVHIAKATRTKGVYHRALRLDADVEAVLQGTKSIYTLALPEIRFQIGDFGNELLARLLDVDNHPDSEALHQEASNAMSQISFKLYWPDWNRHVVKMRYLRREAPLRDLDFRALLCSGKDGEEILDFLKSLTNHPDHAALMAELAYQEETNPVKECQERNRQRRMQSKL